MGSTHQTGWSTSRTESAEPKVAERGRRSSGRYKNGGVLRIARTGLDGQRLRQKVQNRKLRQGTVVRSCRYKTKGLLCAARTEQDGRRQEQKVQNPRSGKAAVVWSGRYDNGGVLRAARTGRDGRRQEYKMQNRSMRKGTVVRSGRYKTVEYCTQHAPNGMVNIWSKKCKKVASRSHHSDWQVQQRRSTAHSTHRTG